MLKKIQAKSTYFVINPLFPALQSAFSDSKSFPIFKLKQAFPGQLSQLHRAHAKRWLFVKSLPSSWG
jgi:hypothetical protein